MGDEEALQLRPGDRVQKRFLCGGRGRTSGVHGGTVVRGACQPPTWRAYRVVVLWDGNKRPSDEGAHYLSRETEDTASRSALARTGVFNATFRCCCAFPSELLRALAWESWE